MTKSNTLPVSMLLLPVSDVVKGLCSYVAEMDLTSLAAREMAEEKLVECLLAIRSVNGVPAMPVRPLYANHREARA